jgi:hypothetical protein
MTSRTLAAWLFTLFAAAPALAPAQSDEATLTVARSATGEVRATVSGRIRACGLTALNDEPTFTIDGAKIEVTQHVVGIACMNPPPKDKPYRRTLNLGKLAPGSYTIHWSFPDLSTTYTVPAS